MTLNAHPSCLGLDVKIMTQMIQSNEFRDFHTILKFELIESLQLIIFHFLEFKLSLTHEVMFVLTNKYMFMSSHTNVLFLTHTLHN